MELLPVAAQQRTVGCVLHQSVLEQVGRVRRHALPEKQTGRSVDQAVEAVTAAFGDRAPDKARLAGAIKAAYAEAP